jgi:hypothetical protein
MTSGASQKLRSCQRTARSRWEALLRAVTFSRMEWSVFAARACGFAAKAVEVKNDMVRVGRDDHFISRVSADPLPEALYRSLRLFEMCARHLYPDPNPATKIKNTISTCLFSATQGRSPKHILTEFCQQAGVSLNKNSAYA